ncbi:cohesin complex subunit psm1 [Laetiporus sulphureus 93-53]|uniref:Structural maintenance of chromosomes protein n=1 Tax=Laetiporus sulphureus 93-53 TaxID=1314785 RepID=A0A165EGW6_9APHY|nr:cohesin complex subunit psm1 [Laetiporus sulphureus 93-53]KZT07028.1 cohesin complex subunit psm1 [Laetiporus sulphureus 93-53]
MPLIRIEVCDFKSYRGHQVIGPFRNFTSVIGPNGAGKSNLMDAISFVLGVKSLQLRSSQLKDLVYRGRRLARNPDGELEGDVQGGDDDGEGEGEGSAKKAWVLAAYEDASKKGWTFQRTISTTGASEYKLNGQVVTYSAYNAALVSHNILVKAKNFLVFQGDVEAVASQSPKELTRLIEQISGSLELATEYEKAKEAQDRATENATFNFTKRRGIAGEIKQYKEQKTEAERFEALCQERDDMVLHRILFKLYHIQQALEEHAQAIKTQNEALVNLREEQREHDKALNEARADQAQARSVVLQKEKKIKKAEKALEAKKPDLVQVEAQIKHSERRRDNALKEREKAEQAADKQREQLRVLRADLEKVTKAADDAQEAQRRASQRNLALSPESLEEYRRLKAQASILAVEERQSLETLSRDEKTASRALAQLKDKIEQQIQKADKLKQDKELQSQKRAELEAKVAELSETLATTRQELNNQNDERTRIVKLEAEINEKLVDVHNKLLQAGVDQKETEREAKMKETLASLQRIFPGVRGRVIDLCKPTQRKYETAVSVVLGRNIDAIVVDEEKTAIDCIEYMRNQRAGQATFIPLDTIQVKPINDKFRSFAKGVRLAVDVIQYEPAVERAMHHACGNALVCDTMEVARYVCYEKGQEVKAVTLEGTIIHKSGLITGGRSTHGTSRKWEEKDVQGLQRVRDNLLGQLRDLNKSKPRGKADDNLIAEITRLESALTIAKDDLAACKLRLDGIKDELRHVDKEIKRINPELHKAQSAYDKLKEQMDELASIVNAEEDGVFADFCGTIGVANIREFEERQLKVIRAESEARLQFDTQIARLTHQSKFVEEQLQMTEERLQTIIDVVQTEEENITRYSENKVNIEEEIKAANEAITTLQKETKEHAEVLEEKSKVVEKVKKTTMKAARRLDEALKEIANRNDEIEKLGLERSATYRKCRLDEVGLPLLEGSLKNVPMEENLRQEFAMDVDEEEDGMQHVKRIPDYGIEVDFESLDNDEREDGSAEALAEIDTSIAKLNAEIEHMAPNLKAMERLDDVEAKLLETEKEADKARKDSKNARDHFNDVKRRRCELFNKAYNHISEHIDEVYKDLTKGKAAPMGGVAYLSLEDSEEPYTAGIKYHAMPPMKRFRDMEQLSGGEKTIAALALLFAIHSYQPSPFFVLDEVDAALDNTNVAKIANYIRSHASDTFQFIVISLKGSLYERSNSLVGIYRDQDVNSSRTLTLDLTQYDE